MTMHILPGGRVGIGKSIFLPEADRNEMIEFPVWSVLLRHALANVLFDSGCHPAVADNAEARWGGLAKFMTPVMGSHDKVIAAPSGLGLGPRGHRRRRQFAPPFRTMAAATPSSRWRPQSCRPGSWRRPRRPAVSPAAIRPSNGTTRCRWRRSGIRAISLATDVSCWSRCLSTRRERSAHSSLSAQRQFLLAGDAVSLRASLDRHVAPRDTWNADALLRAFDEIRRLESGGATVLCGHLQQWATLHAGAQRL
jgi:N-acyl homoserine lactone hydrolase